MTEKRSPPNPSRIASRFRRNLVKGITLLPLAAAGLPERGEAGTAHASTVVAHEYTPVFFSSAEWEFVRAACDRLIPADEIGPGALELGVPEFLDRHMQSPYANGQLWYMQGPFIEAPPQLGYQGRLSVRELLRVGIKDVDAHCVKSFDGKTFARLGHAPQEQLLKSLESGTLVLEGVSSKFFFAQLLAETRYGYFADPVHGGNKGMGSWKMIGYPGMRADYTDWVEVRDKPYPLPPVDLAGRRG